MAEEHAPHSPPHTPQTTPKPTLADLLTIEPSVSIFYSYARELKQSAQFSDKDAKLTIFAPTNKAIMALPRKPWVHARCRPISESNESALSPDI